MEDYTLQLAAGYLTFCDLTALVLSSVLGQSATEMTARAAEHGISNPVRDGGCARRAIIPVLHQISMTPVTATASAIVSASTITQYGPLYVWICHLMRGREPGR